MANKLSNIVCSDASAEIVADTDDTVRPHEFLDESFRKCFANLNLIAARTFGIGGVVLKPYIYNGAIYTDIIPQNRFFIVEQHGEVITKAVFIADTVSIMEEKKTEVKYTRLEYHTLEDGVYTVENKVVACDSSGTKDEEGREVALAGSPFADMPELARITGVKQMLFGFVKCPVDNKRDFSSIYGVPVTYGQEKLIKLILDLLNEIPDEYKNKKSFIGADDVLFDPNDNLPKGGLYRLFRAMGSVDTAPFWEVFSPEIRHTSYFAGLDYLFGLLEKAICVNAGMLTDLDMGNATATAIKRSTLDTFSTVHAMRRNLEGAFDALIYAFGVIADAFDLCERTGADYRVKFDWDYRLLEDTGETWKQMLDAYNAGAAELHELRMYLFGEDKKTAKGAIKGRRNKSAGTQRAEAVCGTKFHEVLYDGEICAVKIFASSGRFDNGLTLNPFSREHWNMAEQARIYRDNPMIAKFLMRS